MDRFRQSRQRDGMGECNNQLQYRLSTAIHFRCRSGARSELVPEVARLELDLASQEHSTSAPGSNGSIVTVNASNNSIATILGSGTKNGALIRSDVPPAAGPVTGSYTLQNNYMDDRGTTGFFTSGGVTGSKVCAGNFDLFANSRITGSVGGMTCS